MRQNIKMKKILICFLFLSFPVISLAGNLCDSWERKIAPDMQIEESLFTKENAKLAKLSLLELDLESKDNLIQFAIKNHNKIIKGFKLKNKATESEEALNFYCSYFINQAFYHD